MEIGTLWPSEAYEKDSDRQGEPHAHMCTHKNTGRQSLSGKEVHLFRNICGELLEAQPCSEGKAKENDTGLEGKMKSIGKKENKAGWLVQIFNTST